ncbi:MAG: DNA polymerase III subunit delta, partial [Gemmataceae bacterium]
MDALAFLDKPPATPQPIYVLFGEEDFLRRRCRDRLIQQLLGEDNPEFAIASYAPEKLDFSTIRNEVSTLPFLARTRIVIVEQADPFVSTHREALEKYAAKPSSVGVLILEPKTFPETTKLAKALPDAAKLACKGPAPAKLAEWLTKWAKTGHGKKLSLDTANYLMDFVSPQMGLLDQELEKLAIACGNQPEITAALVDKLVGRSRAANVFHILDAIGDGKPGKALSILAELFR